MHEFKIAVPRSGCMSATRSLGLPAPAVRGRQVSWSGKARRLGPRPATLPDTPKIRGGGRWSFTPVNQVANAPTAAWRAPCEATFRPAVQSPEGYEAGGRGEAVARHPLRPVAPT